jgi:hypothetical protein
VSAICLRFNKSSPKYRFRSGVTNYPNKLAKRRCNNLKIVISLFLSVNASGPGVNKLVVIGYVLIPDDRLDGEITPDLLVPVGGRLRAALAPLEAVGPCLKACIFHKSPPILSLSRLIVYERGALISLADSCEHLSALIISDIQDVYLSGVPPPSNISKNLFRAIRLSYQRQWMLVDLVGGDGLVHEDGPQVGDVAGGQAQRVQLGELSVGGDPRQGGLQPAEGLAEDAHSGALAGVGGVALGVARLVLLVRVVHLGGAALSRHGAWAGCG